MNLNTNQKKIIKSIVEERVWDILSFVKEFGYIEEYKVDKNKIELLFKEQEKNKHYPVIVVESFPLNKSIDNTEERPAKLVYSGGDVEVELKERKFVYKLFDENNLIISTSFDEIKNFIAIWEYLKSELDVLEVMKEVSYDEVGLFFRKIHNPAYDRRLSKLENNTESRLIPLDIPKFKISDKPISLDDVICEKVPAIDLLETTLACDRDKLYVCEKYLDKKIIPTPALRNFVSSDFCTPEQISTRKSLRLAWLAILLSLFTTAFSVYATYNVDPSDTNLKQIQSQLTDIGVKIDSSNEQQLRDILITLKNINIPESYDDSEIQEKIDELIDIIQQSHDINVTQ